MPSVVGILAVAELKELMSTRNRPTNKFILTVWFNREFKIVSIYRPGIRSGGMRKLTQDTRTNRAQGM